MRLSQLPPEILGTIVYRFLTLEDEISCACVVNAWAHASLLYGRWSGIPRSINMYGWSGDSRWRKLIQKVVRRGGMAFLKILLDVTPMPEEYGWHLLMVPALKASRWDVVRLLIDDFGVSAGIRNGRLVVVAAKGGHYDMVKWLVEVKHVDPDAQQGRAFTFASWKKQGEIAAFLEIASAAQVDKTAREAHGELHAYRSKMICEERNRTYYMRNPSKVSPYECDNRDNTYDTGVPTTWMRRNVRDGRPVRVENQQ